MPKKVKKSAELLQGPLALEDVIGSCSVQTQPPVELPPPVTRLTIDGDLGGRPPTVSTRVVESGDSLILEVSTGNCTLAPFTPVAEVVAMTHRQLKTSGTESPTPTMIEGDRIVAPLRRGRRRRPPVLKFGDTAYTPTTVFKPDGRRPYSEATYPWHCIIRLENRGNWTGSGALVGPRHVVAASHCIDWNAPGADVRVFFNNGNGLAFASATHIYFSTKVVGKVGWSENDEDYVVLVLDRRLGDRYGWLGCRTYNSSWDDETTNWWSMGYPQDFSFTGQTPTRQTHFMLNELGADYGSARLIRSSTFDNWPGQSGSAVFGFWNDGPYVVGVVSGENPSYNLISGGSLLTSLVRRARGDHP